MIPSQLAYTGGEREFQFRDQFIMPLLVRLGFGIVVIYHRSRKFGRDVMFGDIDRFAQNKESKGVKESKARVRSNAVRHGDRRTKQGRRS